MPAGIILRPPEERPAVAGIALPGRPAKAPGRAPETTGTLPVVAFGEDAVRVASDE